MYGRFSSSANARRYNAIKILTAYATQGHKNGQIIELKLLQKIKKIRHNDYLPSLSDHFEVNGPHGKHLCLVLGVLSSDISSFRRSAPGKRLPIQTVKRIITFILVCLNELHIAKIIHTGSSNLLTRLQLNITFNAVDVKADNFLFDAGLGAEFDGGSKALPPIVVGEFELNGERYPIMKSQPIQHSFRSNDPPWEVDRYRVHLCDVGHGA
jgi:serine/threonine-protein kinase SRPK3